MSPPICHRSLGPMTRSFVNGMAQDQHAFGYECLGSTCALWRPNYGRRPGVGTCSDNTAREPWLDPAAPKTGGAS